LLIFRFIVILAAFGSCWCHGADSPVIVIPKDPTPVENYAAAELQEHLKLASGAAPKIISGTSPGSPAFYIGRSAPGELPKFKPDEIMLKSLPDGSIILAGGESHGTLYAVYELLEKYYGVRWWTSTDTFVPKVAKLSIPKNVDIRYVPPVLIRECFYDDVIHHPKFASRLRSNGHRNRLSKEMGGHFEIIGFVHTFGKMIPPKVYFDKHPEWFSEIDGKRCSKRGVQLCLSNPEVVEVLTQKVLEKLRKHPDPRVISVSQNDFYMQCKCAKCVAIDKEEGSPAGTLLRAINKVAEAVEKEFPNVRVETLAYQYTQPAPKITRPRHNVLVRLCTIRLDYSQPIEAKGANEPTRASLDEWAKIAPELAVWNYVTNYWNYFLPHPILRNLDDHIRYFAKCKAQYIFEQGITSAGDQLGDFAPMRAWVIAKLLWNPQLKGEALIDEFLLGYYGPKVAPVLKKYLWLLEDEIAAEDKYKFGCYHRNTKGWLTIPTLIKARELMRQARELAADDPELSRRVDMAALSIDLATMERYLELVKAGVKLPKPDKLVDNLAMRLEKYNMRKFGEDWYGPFKGKGKRKDMINNLRNDAKKYEEVLAGKKTAEKSKEGNNQ
jgi:hypothetical protein